MSFNRPKIDELDLRVRADMQANMDNVPIILRRSPEAAIARALAGAAHELHGHAQHNFRQLFPDTAELTNLERQAGFYGLVRRQASRASGHVRIDGADGTAIPAGSRFGSPDGDEFITAEAGVIAAGSVTLALDAVLAGAAGNLGSGALVTFLSPIAGASNEAMIAPPGMARGADIESKESLSERVQERMRQVPHGGAANDYVRWAKEAPGVTRAWLASNEMGLGSVTLRFVTDDSPNGLIPSDAEVEAVRLYVENRAANDPTKEGRPVTAQMFVAAPIPAPVDIELTSTPDDPATRAAIETELRALFRNASAPGAVVGIGTIAQAISLAPGLVSQTLVSPTMNASASIGHLPVLGEITWL